MTAKSKNPARKTMKPAAKKASATKKDAATVAAASTPKPPRSPKAPKPTTERDPRLPAPGTTVTRVFNGKALELKALADGTFEFDGKPFTSVSGAAKAASGLASVDGFGWWGLNPGAKREPKARDARLPKAGTTLAVSRAGKIYEIEVGEHDFKWKGEAFTSLSALAKKASGAKSINGYLWAGLAGRPAAATGRADMKPVEKGAKGRNPAEPKIGDGNDLATPAGQRAALAAAGIGKPKGAKAKKPATKETK